MSKLNLFSNPEAFDNAAWTKSLSTVTANAAADPYGGTRADKFIDTAAAGIHEMYQYAATPPAAGRPYVWSCHVKGAERTHLQLLPYNPTDGSPAFITCDASNGTVPGVLGTGGVIAAGGGWYRYWVTFTPTATPTALLIRLNDAAFASSYTGDGTSGILLFGAQVEAGSFPTSYLDRERRPLLVLGTRRGVPRGQRSRRAF